MSRNLFRLIVALLVVQSTFSLKAAIMNTTLTYGPESNFSRRYLYSLIDTTSKYETYVGTELVNWIGKYYPNICKYFNKS